MNEIEEHLNSIGVSYIKHSHPPVFTCEEAAQHCAHIPGISSKNLLLQDEKKRRYFLVIVPDYKRADLKLLAPKLSVKKLSFASPQTLKMLLNLDPGSVSPFGLLNDKQAKVELVIDQDIWNSDIVTFHPNDNTATLQLAQEMFRKYLKTIGREATIIIT